MNEVERVRHRAYALEARGWLVRERGGLAEGVHQDVALALVAYLPAVVAARVGADGVRAVHRLRVDDARARLRRAARALAVGAP
jgi:hypothetical protein